MSVTSLGAEACWTVGLIVNLVPGVVIAVPFFEETY